MRVQIIGKPTFTVTGTSRYAAELCNGLRTVGVDVSITFPESIPLPVPISRFLRRFGIGLQDFFNSYPLRVQLERVDVYHITMQTMSSLLWFQKFQRPVIITVHDIIPYVERRSHSWFAVRQMVDTVFYRMALRALRRAMALIAVSEYTRQSLIKELGINPQLITVVHEPVDLDRFRPCDVTGSFYEQFALGEQNKKILYVGSDDPRKNLSSLFKAFSMVRKEISEAKLLVVGASHFLKERERLLNQRSELNLEEDIQFFGAVSDDELILFYNASQVVVMPSFLEGFGLPVIEAMACGRPVIVSTGGALPEIAGDAAMLVEPTDIEAMASAMIAVLTNDELARTLSSKSLLRAQAFHPSNQAKGTLEVYLGL